MREEWWKEAVVYQIYPRSFYDSNNDGVGDINGIIQKLDYLKELGIDVIWLSPVYQYPNADNGYDISDYHTIMKEFGTMEDFDHLLNEAHKRNLRIVMDLVVNHTSDEHEWFTKSRSLPDSRYRDYYIWKRGKNGGTPNNWGSWFYNSAWEYEADTDMYYLHIFSKKQPDLNWDNPLLREEIYSMMTWWLDKGGDGFRMDVISLISKNPSFPDGEVTGAYGDFGDLTPYCENGPRVHEYLQEMNDKVLSKYDIMTVGETPNASVDDAAKFANCDGTELNMVFQFEHVSIDYGQFGKYTENRYRLKDLIAVLSKWQDGLCDKGWNSLYWENHDQPRSVTRFGDVSTPLYWEKSGKMLATCLYMLQGTPYIYQGQEIGMTNPRFESFADYKDIEAKNAHRDLVEEQKIMTEDQFLRCVFNLGRDNARTPMQWNNSSYAGFSKEPPWMKVNPDYQDINVEKQQNDPDSILSYYKTLIKLRKNYKVIVYGKYELLNPISEYIWAYKRKLDNTVMTVMANFSDHTVGCEYFKQESGILLSNYRQHQILKLQPYEVIVQLEQ